MPTVIGMLVHGLSYWGAAWLLRGGSALGVDWLVCYAAGIAALAASAWFPKLRLSSTQALQLIAYSLLLAVLVFGANSARSILGNSVRLSHLYDSSVPPHFLLAPGATSFGIGALVAGVLRKRRSAGPHASREA